MAADPTKRRIGTQEGLILGSLGALGGYLIAPLVKKGTDPKLGAGIGVGLGLAAAYFTDVLDSTDEPRPPTTGT